MTKAHEAMSLDRLKDLQLRFGEVGIAAKLVEKSESFAMDTLLVSAEDDYQGRTQLVNLAYVNDLSDEESNLALLQYFTEIEPVFQPEQLPMMESLLNFINVRMPLGHFCTQSGKVYFRYVMTDSKTSDEHAMKVIETFFTYVDVMDIFQESIEKIIAGEISLEAFKSKF